LMPGGIIAASACARQWQAGMFPGSGVAVKLPHTTSIEILDTNGRLIIIDLLHAAWVLPQTELHFTAEEIWIICHTWTWPALCKAFKYCLSFPTSRKYESK